MSESTVSVANRFEEIVLCWSAFPVHLRTGAPRLLRSQCYPDHYVDPGSRIHRLEAVDKPREGVRRPHRGRSLGTFIEALAYAWVTEEDWSNVVGRTVV